MKNTILICMLLIAVKLYSQPSQLPKEPYEFLLEQNNKYELKDIEIISYSAEHLLSIQKYKISNEEPVYFNSSSPSGKILKDKKFLKLFLIDRDDDFLKTYLVTLVNKNNGEKTAIYIHLHKDYWLLRDFYINRFLIETADIEEGTYLVNFFEDKKEIDSKIRINATSFAKVSNSKKTNTNDSSDLVNLDVNISNRNDYFIGYYQWITDSWIPRVKRGAPFSNFVLKINNKSMRSFKKSNQFISVEDICANKNSLNKLKYLLNGVNKIERINFTTPENKINNYQVE